MKFTKTEEVFRNPGILKVNYVYEHRDRSPTATRIRKKSAIRRRQLAIGRSKLRALVRFPAKWADRNFYLFN